MSNRKIDFASLSIKDYVVGVVYAVLATAVITGAELTFGFVLPDLLAPALGAAIGFAAWYIYLLRRNANAR